jgi:hypothetical protein
VEQEHPTKVSGTLVLWTVTALKRLALFNLGVYAMVVVLMFLLEVPLEVAKTTMYVTFGQLGVIFVIYRWGVKYDLELPIERLTEE